jgi:hypothetical protein
MKKTTAGFKGTTAREDLIAVNIKKLLRRI